MKNLEVLSSFAAAAAFLGLDPEKSMPVVSGIPEKHAKALVSVGKLFVISEAAWKLHGSKIDWSDWNQEKYYPWAKMSAPAAVGSGAGFSYFGYFYGYSHADVGARLVFPTEEMAKYVFEQNIEDYRNFMVIPE